MPNSGFQGQINQCFYGTRKGDLLPLGQRYAAGNLPNPAFWGLSMRGAARGVIESDTPRVLTTTEVLAPVRPPNIHTRGYPRHGENRSKDGTLPRLMTSPTRTSGLSYHAPPAHVAPPTSSRGHAHHARDAHIPLVALNSLAPFATANKPTCGFFFSRSTDNKKKRMGIPATDLVKYRYYVK